MGLFNNIINNFQNNLFIYILISLLSYVFGYISKDLKFNRLKLFIIQKSLPITLLTLLLAIFIPNPDFRLGTVTFASIYFGFWLGLESGYLQEKQRLKKFLGLLWQELRQNRNQFNNIRANYHFILSNFSLLSFDFQQFDNIRSMIKSIKRTIYDSFIVSGNINAINVYSFGTVYRADDIFNTLEIYFNNIEYLKSVVDVIGMTMTNAVTLESKLNGVPEDVKIKIMMSLREKIKQAAKEVSISYRTCLKAIFTIERALDYLKVNPEETEERISVLTSEDNDFIDNIFKAPNIPTS